MPMHDKTTGDEAQIRKLIEHWAYALRAKDLDGVMASFTPDATTFDLAPPLQQDTAGRRQALSAWFPGFSGPIGYEIGNLDIAVGVNVAFCCSLNRLSARTVSGEEFAIWVRVTMGFRKVDGTWKIAHAHTSVPFYMDGSFKAATDLEP
jgi:ketosteroid isomerase-like protein